MSERSPMTVKGHQELKVRLDKMKKEDRPAASKAIEIARAHGDLSENAEYHAAKEHQGMLEAKIKILEAKLSIAQVVDISKLSGERVVFGATVEIEDVDTGEPKKIVIVGEEESNIEKGHIAFSSPLAKSLLGKNLDDLVKVRLPGGDKEYEITSVNFEEI